ncbi:MAG: hypothetical protein IPJ69_06420 [Deltaproteobacteria bacterium]|nr:MAG: hypothetical protein IPJ69_06420 [Deltaproteobacteria bacterium]
MATTPNRIEKNWEAVVPFLKRTWPKLTEFDIEQVSGRYDRLIQTIKNVYGGNAPIMQEAHIKQTLQTFLNDLEKVNS